MFQRIDVGVKVVCVCAAPPPWRAHPRPWYATPARRWGCRPAAFSKTWSWLLKPRFGLAWLRRARATASARSSPMQRGRHISHVATAVADRETPEAQCTQMHGNGAAGSPTPAVAASAAACASEMNLTHVSATSRKFARGWSSMATARCSTPLGSGWGGDFQSPSDGKDLLYATVARGGTQGSEIQPRISLHAPPPPRTTRTPAPAHPGQPACRARQPLQHFGRAAPV
mmetsp:Transcript_120591/g.336480  ORF Transcript_120591/g.336480 Transcript_120591/m.336480 type:complete len:228 (+) Transcript_120591:518-1201(+)